MSNESSAPTIAQSVEDQLTDARLRVLIVGGGIAGATLGALLRQRHEPAAIIERADPDTPSGYMLGMLPLGGRVLNGLGLRPDYVAASVPVEKYALHGRDGQLIRDYPVDDITDRYGLYRGIERGALLSLLRSQAGEIIYGASILAIDQDERQARVTFSDHSSAELDLVVIADGIHSSTRSLVLADDEVDHFDTRWGGFVTWCETAPGQEGTYREVWGTDWMLGLYPVPGRTGMFLGGQSRNIEHMDPFDYADALLARDLPEPFAESLRTIDRSAEAKYWPMADIRSEVWWRDRSVLLGDAAAAFLPTAGVGASAAMDAGAALSDELSRADKDQMGFALTLYERRQRHRTEAAQKNSRKLAKYMFEKSSLMTFMRDQAMHFYSPDMMLSDIKKVMEGQVA